MIPCDLCGRSFNQKALVRHQKICKKVFGEKRKEFNSAANRKPEELLAMENESKMHKKKSKKGSITKVSRNDDNSVDKHYDDQALNAKAEKQAKWKAQSEQLRLAMKVSKGGLSQEEQVQMKKLTEDADTRKQCPFCNRKFNDEAFKRHYEFCKTKQKKIR